MKIAMRKLSSSPKDINLRIESGGETITEYLELKGQIKRIDSKIFLLEANVYGQLELICDRSGELYVQTIKYPLALHITDGICNMQSQNKKLDDFEIIEFLDGFVDLNYILESEIESIRSDYHARDE